jgi:hypothetical protein
VYSISHGRCSGAWESRIISVVLGISVILASILDDGPWSCVLGRTVLQLRDRRPYLAFAWDN